MYAPLFESQLPRYGEKKTWVGTTGAGQNCPERESESLGENIFSRMVSSFWFLRFLFRIFPRSIDQCCSISDAQRHSEHARPMHMPMHMHSPTVNNGIDCSFRRSNIKKDHVSAKRAQSFFKKTRSAGISGACLVDDDLAEAVMGPAIHRTAPPQRTDCFFT